MTPSLTIGQAMLTPPDAIVAVLLPFATLFQNRTWLKVQVLLVGTILTPGRRTVAAALRVMGLSGDRNHARYHHVLNRAAWSPLQVSQVLLKLLLQHRDRGDRPLVFGIDETLERRQGPQISALGIYRDAVRSSRSYLVKASGLRWISLMWLGHIPWAGRYWALPFLTVLAPSERYHQRRGRSHKKLTDWARQMILQLRRWLPRRPRPAPLLPISQGTGYSDCQTAPGCWPLRTGTTASPGPDGSAPGEGPAPARVETTPRPA